jgi:amino acid adenylation domain-containing protein
MPVMNRALSLGHGEYAQGSHWSRDVDPPRAQSIAKAVLLAVLLSFLICYCIKQEEIFEYSAVPGRRRIESQRLLKPTASVMPARPIASGGPHQGEWPAGHPYEILTASFRLWDCNRSERASPFEELVPVRRFRTEPTKPLAPCLHKLFEQQAKRTPHAVAVRFAGAHVSYDDLNKRANQLAHYLQKRGVRPDMPVGIFLPRSLETIVAVLGILKAGGAYLPIDPNLPIERLQFALHDAQAHVLLTRQDCSKSLKPILTDTPVKGPCKLSVIYLDQEWEALAHERNGNAESDVTPANLVYVIYTSGSTGTPKGVLIPHSALGRHSLGFAERFNLGPEERVLQFAPLSFDVSAEEIFPALISGSTVILRPESLSASIEEFHHFLIQERVTVVNLPTSFWAAWMDGWEARGLRLPDSLRLVIVGSETVTAGQYAQWQKLAGSKVHWCNAYGTTETTITSTVFEPEDGKKLSVIPIGRPLDFAQAYILDTELRPVQNGAVGELHLGGEALARGYLNRPELTASRFIPNPFGDDPHARLYKTGDLVRLRDDGNIEFLGRLDHQVKIRGHRVEAGEIEATLKQHPLVKDAAVIIRDNARGEKQLVAYYTTSHTTPASALVAYLKDRLPTFMVPSVLMELENLPLMANGKLDRHAFPEPATAEHHSGDDFVPPASTMEKTIAAIWCELLGVNRISVHDNFFDLGGDSLVALRFCAQLESRIGSKLTATALFELPNISRLAERLQKPERAGPKSCLTAIQPKGSCPPLYLVHGAGGGMLWGYNNLAARLGPDQPLFAFNSRGALGLKEFSRIEDMAEHYVNELCAFQPSGSVRLGGYCFGGEVAFEMARQLTARGRQIALLALFNAMAPNSSYERVSWNPRTFLPFIQNAWRWLDYFRQWTPEQRRSLVQRKWRSVLGACRSTNTETALPHNSAVPSFYPEFQRRLWDIHLGASSQYSPKPYAGRITLFRTSIHPFFSSFDPECGWGQFAQEGVIVHMMPGAHESILDEPHVQIVAEHLNQVLKASS